ncbi:hypothetical protein AWZ03_004222 [Drosophila navojoa]|uniref:Uncharacterized protein n=1 Tax=Drosophila navojoa TaxID=7232 RepID=A0A484BL04_DRONA|nr:hypothetical protein AWZ03_004222 [Drosophila navojoa]
MNKGERVEHGVWSVERPSSSRNHSAGLRQLIWRWHLSAHTSTHGGDADADGDGDADGVDTRDDDDNVDGDLERRARQFLYISSKWDTSSGS